MGKKGIETTMGVFLVKRFDSDKVDAGATVCIDFGTALCKAAVSVQARGQESIFPLKLGELAEDPRRDYEYFCQSSLYISRERKVYFGHRAEEKWATDLDAGIGKIESIKRWFSTDPITAFESETVDPALLPPGTKLTKRVVVILLLAYVSRLVGQGLRKHSLSSYATRRFSRPAWGTGRATWIDKTMRECLGAAQVVADSIGGHWAEDGLPLEPLIQLIDDASCEPIPDRFIEKRGVLEPIAAGFLAAGASGNQRDISIVVDVGAGTTDIAAFLSRSSRGLGLTGSAESIGAPSSVPFAGDYLDWVLLGEIERDLGRHWISDKRYHIEAQGKVRGWKEDLFRTEAITPTFVDGTVCSPISLARFVRDERVGSFTQEIRQPFSSLFPSQTVSGTSAIDHILRGVHAAESINVIFAGGGAALPMLRSLTSSPLIVDKKKISLVRQEMRLSAHFAHSNEYARRYPQLAVAMGGASVQYPWGAKARHFGLGAGKQVF